jgi:hypothetical protein
VATTILPPAETGLRVRTFASLGTGLVCAGAAIIGYLTVALRAQVDPLADPVSDDAFYREGEVLFVTAILLVLFGGLLIAAAATQAGMRPSRSTTVLFGSWGAGLSLVAVFQGNQNAADPTWHGELHRFGGAVFLSCLPLACWTLARTLSAQEKWVAVSRRLGRLAAISVVTAAAFGLAQVVPALPEGLLERIALIAELAVLLAVASAARKAAR